MTTTKAMQIDKPIKCAGGYTVETWYDQNSRQWVTQTKDAKGNQVGDAMYDGARVSAACSQIIALKQVAKLVTDEHVS